MKEHYIVVGTCQKLLRQVLLALRSTGNANCVVIGGKNTHSLKWTSLCSKNVAIEFDTDLQTGASSRRQFVELVNQFASDLHDAILIPADCEGTRMVNRVKAQLRVKIIPHADMATLNMLDDKWRFFEFCKMHALKVPETHYIGDKSALDYASLSRKLGVPFVVKPINQAGSTGVHVVHDEAFFNKVILGNDAYQFDKLIAQRYIDGIDLCFNFLSMNGEISAFTIQQRVGSTVKFLSNPELERLGRRLAKAANYDGVMCVDARVDARTQEVYLIESNPRFWASLGASVWCGVNFVRESVKQVQRRDGALTITSGIFHERHPVLRPTAWKAAMFDPSGHGRIVRANMRDLPVVASIFRSLPVMAWNFSVRRMAVKGSIGKQKTIASERTEAEVT